MSKFPEFNSINNLSIDFSNSASRNATIYGNGRNQVAVIIKLSLLDKEGHFVPVSESVLREAVYLCDYRTGKKIPDDQIWFYSKEKNDYCQPVSFGPITRSSEKSNADHFTTVEIYVSAKYSSAGKLISCGINIDDIGDVDTSQDGTGNELPNGQTYLNQNFVTVTAKEAITYHKDNLTITPIYELEKGKNKVRYGTSTEHVDKFFDCYYDNYYITIPSGIKNAETHEYGRITEEKKWICAYDSNHNNQHMIVAHPYNKKGTESFGFRNTAAWGSPDTHSPLYAYAEFDLTKSVTFNEENNAICFTQINFSTDQWWLLPDNKGLDKKAFHNDTWFELYDIYGNYGKFNVRFTDDHQYIEITNR